MTWCRAIWRSWPLLLAMLVAVGGHSALRGETQALDRPLRFQRIFVPDEKLFRELCGMNAGLLRERAEFERLVRALAPQPEQAQSAQAHLTRGVYRARLEDAQFVAGEATLEVRHSGAGRAALSLGNANLAIQKATWRTEPAVEAVLATTEAGQRIVEVDRSGSLSLNWSLRGESDPFGEVTFTATLPPCAANQLTVEIPFGWRLETNDGFVGRGAEVAPQEGRTGAFQWTVELGAARQAELRVTRDGGAQRQLVPLRQRLTYDLRPSGGELNAVLTIDAHQQPLRRLELQLSPDLDLGTVLLSGQELPLTRSPAAAGQPRRVVVHFPEPLSGAERELHLRAWLPVETDHNWKLPGLRVEDAVWQEGAAVLRIIEPLRLYDLKTSDCRQMSSSSLPSPAAGQAVEVQYHAADAGMELLLGVSENRIEVATGATLEVDSVAVAAQVVAEVRAVAGSTFDLDMSLPTGWTVESLRTEPAEALYDYDVIPRGQQPQLVRMRLSTGVVPEQTTPLRILLRAHRRLPAQGAALSIDQIRLGEFVGVNVVRRLIAVPAAQFQLSGDVHVERLDPLAMPDDDARLVSGGADRIVLVDDRRARALRLSLVTERPRFTADVEITARIDAAALVEDYRLQIRPQATPVGRLLVHFSRLRDETLQWSLSGNSSLAVLAQKVSLDDEPTPGMAGGETWEITLQRPRSVPFELRATRRSSGKGKRRISLASAPQAETQSGTVTIDSSAGAGVEIDGDGLRSVPADTRAMDRLNDTRAVFRYEPSQEASLDVAPAAAADSQPSLWAWVCRLTTYCGAGGVAHTATYQLETAGVRQLEVVLPDGCDLQQVLIDGREVRTTSAADAPRRFSVALPPEQRYPTLDIVFRESAVTLPALVGRLEPRLPQLIDVPLLQRQWIVWTPPGYGAVELSESEPPFVAEILGVRLFGSLWRSAGHPFQLFSEDDWASLTTNVAPQAESQQAAQRCLNTLAALIGDGRSVSPGMKWGQLLTAYQAAPPADGPLPRLRIDALALAVAGVGPQTPLPTAPDRASKDSGAAQVVWMLESSNLVLLTSSEEALLTTIAAAREARVLNASSPAGDRRTGVVLLEGLQQFEQVRHLSPGVFPKPEIWAAASIDQLTPWKASNKQPFAAVSDSGWHAQRFELRGDEDQYCTVARWPLITAMSWAVVLLTAAGGFLLAVGRPPRLALLLGLAVVVALLTPPPFTTLATGAVLGVLLACGMVAAFASRPPSDMRWDAESGSMLRRTGDTTRTLHRAMLLLVAAVGCSAAALGVGVIGSSAMAEENPVAEKLAAENDAPVAGEQSPLLYPVIIQVDEEGQPVDEYIHVPDPLWNALKEREQHIAQPRHSVLLLGADYECRFERRSDDVLAIEELTATFAYEVIGKPGPMARYVVPLDRSELDLYVDGGALLDGSPTSVRLEAEGTRLSVPVERPGQHELVLRFSRPRSRVSDGRSTLDFAIPRISTARLRCTYPRDASGIETPSALGASTHEPAARRITSDLGPAERLRLAWPTEGRPDAESAPLEVEQWMWLKLLRPGTVRIDAKFRFRRAGPINEIRLLADPRLRLLPLSADQPVLERHEHMADVKTIHLEFKQAFDEEVTLYLSFLRTGASGIGNLQVPQLQAVADRVVARRLAVTVSSQLEFEQNGRLPTLPPEQFLEQWGGGGPALESPDLAFDLPASAEPMWSLATRPKSPTSVYSAATDVTYGGEGADLVFLADVVTEEGYVFQHRLTTPLDLQIDEVSVLVKDQETAARWSRDDDGVLTVMLDRRATGRQVVRLAGRIPVGKRRVTLPQVSLLDAVASDAEFRVYRTSEVQARVVQSSGLSPLDNSTAPAVQATRQTVHSPSLRRLVVAFRRQDDAPPQNAAPSADKLDKEADREKRDGQAAKAKAPAPTATLEILPNHPRTSCRSITTLRRSDGKWSIEADCRLNVANGVLDEFWLEAPDRLVQPFEISPPADFVVTSVPGQARRRVVIRPDKPFQDAATITIRASLSPPLAGERIVFPDIVPLGVDDTEQFIVVPTRAESQRYVWETSGLQAAELPSDIAASGSNTAPRPEQPSGSLDEEEVAAQSSDATIGSSAIGSSANDLSTDDGRAVWRVVASRYSASLKLLERSAAATAQVHLADIHFAWDRDGACRGLATFDLEPAGLASCVLVLPPAYRLVQANVAGLPAQLRKLAENRWRLTLGPAQLPQRIVVLFAGQLPPEPLRRRVLAAPQLLNISVERTLWTVYAPSEATRVQPLGENTESTEANLNLYRYAAFASLVDRAADVALEQPRIDVDRWYLPWARRLATGRERLTAYLDASGVNPYQERVDAIDSQQLDDAQRLDVTHIRSLAVPTLGPADVWAVSLEGRSPSIYCSLTGSGSGELELAVVRPPVSDIGLRLLLAPLFVAGALLVYLLLTRSPLSQWLARWPHAVGVLLGLAWWLWLTPSLVGWLIVFVSVVAALRSPWRTTPATDPAPLSSIVRRSPG